MPSFVQQDKVSVFALELSVLLSIKTKVLGKIINFLPKPFVKKNFNFIREKKNIYLNLIIVFSIQI